LLDDWPVRLRRWDPTCGVPVTGGAYALREKAGQHVFAGRSVALGWRVFAYARSGFVAARSGQFQLEPHALGQGSSRPVTLKVAPRLQSSSPLSEARFWELIEQMAGPIETAPARIDSVLAAQPEELVAGFHASFETNLSRLYVWPLWHVAYIVHGGCSDDGFEYFRSWLLMQGRATVHAALADPEGWALTLPLPDQGGPRSFEAELASYVAAHQYLDRTGQVLASQWPDPAATPSGDSLPEESIYDALPALTMRWAEQAR
jgi:Protein of unknown function (DUF4240)